ncbi:hypothetical protein COCON_G00003960 [Conger conger]|uniref:Uncharacterized protein n=1 Tax=Conger conger TaxID=82655 RepID=A0A9Q1E166_CONCO|nr:hypothetical protein COCON_G00003960 [Conger conger]
MQCSPGIGLRKSHVTATAFHSTDPGISPAPAEDKITVPGLCLPVEWELKWGPGLLAPPVRPGAASSHAKGHTSRHGATPVPSSSLRPRANVLNPPERGRTVRIWETSALVWSTLGAQFSLQGVGPAEAFGQRHLWTLLLWVICQKPGSSNLRHARGSKKEAQSTA